MEGNIREIQEDTQFAVELANAGSKLVVVDFFATWCEPCRRIAPVLASLSVKYDQAVFLKVDVDVCGEVAQTQGVTAMPTFICYRNARKVDMLRGGDPAALKRFIEKWYQGSEDAEEGTTAVKGHIDLSSFVTSAESECLNESDDHPLAHALTSKGGYLESDCDEQLIINLSFNQAVKLHSLKIWGPEANGPKTIKIFINQPRTLDFDQALGMEPLQLIDLSSDDIKEGSVVQLRYVKLQNVQNVTIFVKDNQSGSETTQIDYLCLVGSTVSTTNMADFKRVAGKKGESH